MPSGRLPRTFFPILACALLIQTPAARADVRLPKVFSDHAVLQRERPIPVWGWASPNESITVKLGDHSAAAAADAEGKWRVDLPAMPAGGPYTLTVTGKNTLTVHDLLVGEVWICTGQSNMQLGLRSTQFARRDIPRAADPQLRLGDCQLIVSGRPQPEGNMSWSPSTPGRAANYSAVAYYFGKQLREQLKVPVGIIHASAGAIPIESWTPAVGCRLIPSQLKVIRVSEQATADLHKLQKENLDAWVVQAHRAIEDDLPLPPMKPLPAVDNLIMQRGWMFNGLYNGTIQPLVPYGIRGVVMYQGEANNGQGMRYYEKMQALIGGWRKVWGEGDFPFLYVQIAPWAWYPPGNEEGIWEAQLASLAIPNTGMAVVTDLVPDLNNIHPPLKEEVARRLSLWALAKVYGRDKLVYSGPLFKSAAIEGGKIRVAFNHLGSGLATRDGKPPNFFQVGTADGFVSAVANIEGNSVVVSSEQMPHPLFVRFAWKNTDQANLINKEGLPASPFRTDCSPVSFSTGSRFARHKRIELFTEPVPGVVRYTLDGTTPTEHSPVYSAPLEIEKTTTVAARLFAANGRSSLTAKTTYTQVPPVMLKGKTLAPGLDYEYYLGRWVALPDFDSLKPEHSGILDGLTPIGFPLSFMCAHRLHGYLDIPTAGKYTFYTKALGGARIFLDGKLVVDDEGFHAPVEKAGPPLTLSAGQHALLVLYHEGGGPPSLSLFYEGPGIKKQEAPASAYFHDESD